jgi:hypothetical protein
MVTRSLTRGWLQAGLLAGCLLAGAGCKQLSPRNNETPQPAAAPPAAATAPAPAPRSDQEIANDIQSRIDAESALNGQDIKISVNGGTATLNGTVNNDAARALAAADSGAATGVRTVINNLTVTPERAVKQAPPPKPEHRHREPSPDEQAMTQPTPAPPPPPAQEAAHAAPAPPPRPPAPVVRTVSVAAGTTLPIRLADSLDTATTQTGQPIHGTLADDIVADDMVAIPRGTPVTGRVIEAKDATHFSGSSSLTLELTEVDLKGGPVAVSTAPFSEQGKGRGKNTAVKAGGGAAIGAIIGALAGGGKGAAIGAASGGGLGAGVNAVTRGEQVKIPAETLINFKLQSPVSVSTSHSANGPAVRTFGDPNADSNQPQ